MLLTWLQCECPDLVYRPLRGTAAGIDVVTISRPDELSGPVLAFLDRSAGVPGG